MASSWADLGAHLISLDVTSKQSCQDAVEKVLAEQGRIDILINKYATAPKTIYAQPLQLMLMSTALELAALVHFWSLTSTKQPQFSKLT